MNKKKILIIIVAVLVVASLGVSLKTFKSEDSSVTAEKSGSETYNFQLEKSSVYESISTTGTIESANSIELVTKLSGELNSVLAEIADSVTAGQVLATIDTTDIEISIAEAKSKISSIEKEIYNLKIEKNSQYKLDYENAKFAYENKEKTYENNLKLFETSALSKLELDSSLESKNKAYQEYQSAKLAYETYDYEKELALLEEDLSIANMNFKSLEKDLGRHQLISPIDGEITNVYVDTGDSITYENTLFEIQDLDDLQVEASISEYEINDIEVGQRVLVNTLGNKEKYYEGVVSKVYPSGEISGSEVYIPIILELLNEDRDLKPNFSANIEIFTKSKDDAFMVPYDALIKTSNGYSVNVIYEGSETPRVIEVETGIEDDMTVEIINDELKEGMYVVVNSSEEITSTTSRNNGIMIPRMGGGGGPAPGGRGGN